MIVPEAGDEHHLRPTGLEVFARFDVSFDDAFASPQAKVGLLRVEHFDGHIWDTLTESQSIKKNNYCDK